MGVQDLIVTPVYIVLFAFLAYFIRPYVTNKQTRKYFLPALWVKFAGAIALGIIYQFYYEGGDTFNYWDHGSKWIYQAFQEDLSLGIDLILDSGGSRDIGETYKYSSRIWYFRDSASYFVVRLTTVFDLFTLHTYSASSLFFALFSFSGGWAMYFALLGKYQNESRILAIAILFIPSVVFWGSGILKDTVTLGALGWLTFALFRFIELGKKGPLEIAVAIISFYLIFSIKIYILMCYLPMVTVWVFLKNVKRIRSIILRILLIPVLLIFFGFFGFFLINQITAADEKYALDNIAERTRITAYDIRYGWGARNSGDGGYDIGLPDGTWQSMIKLMPAAVNVSLFRPYIWEVRNPLMILSALEALIVLILTLKLVLKNGLSLKLKDPFMIFCLGFSILFAFAVGVSTFNFGTLMRYKIPMMPFFLISIINIGIQKK